ncbi:MAG: hypothetical protein NXY59_08325 [Aigarchaeota archaeon]|nr:hypothetical protein [Candidatus Pelearchaeum maunauluense]
MEGVRAVQYFMAVKVGERVATRAQQRLLNYVPSALVAMIVKEKSDGFQPVGEEDLFAVLPVGADEYIIALCDAEGYAKAISTHLSKEETEKTVEKMRRDGIQEFSGRVILPV